MAIATQQFVLSDAILARCAERASIYDRDNRFFTEDFAELRDAGYLRLNVPKLFTPLCHVIPGAIPSRRPGTSWACGRRVVMIPYWKAPSCQISTLLGWWGRSGRHRPVCAGHLCLGRAAVREYLLCTYKLIAGYFDCDDLGLMSLKGLTSKVRVYRVAGERGGRARIDVAREHGFTHLVGRERELERLRHCFDLAQSGRGQAVSIIGAAGFGKSRLLYEFRQTLASHDCLWPDGRCHPYGTVLAYGPIVEMLKQRFQLDASDQDADIQRKVHHGLQELNPTLMSAAPYLLHLLAVETAHGLPAGLAPEAIKHRIFDALQGVIDESAAHSPVVLALEDLHWVDATSAELLSFLLDHLAGTRVLLVCTYRPEFVSTWSRKSYQSVLTLTPLGPLDGRQMLTAVLGMPHIQDELAALVLDKAEGIPLFLEELVHALRNRHDCATRWPVAPDAGGTDVPVPNTVEEVLMPCAMVYQRDNEAQPGLNGNRTHGARPQL
jgi:hypothetical protein